MERPARIAVANLDDGNLCTELRAMPSRPEVRSFETLYDAVDAVVAFRPDVLFVGDSPDLDDLPGALRMLRGLLPGLATFVVVAAEREVEIAPLAQRAGARVLVWPPQPGELAGALERALTGSDRPRDEVFLDLARGFADEINNPLLFLTGHLQLLDARLGASADKDVRDQIAAAIAGAGRIQTSVERIRALSRAAAGPRRSVPVDLRELATQATHAAPARGTPLDLNVAQPDQTFVVAGDPDLLQPAIEQFVQVGREIRELGLHVAIELDVTESAVRLRMQIAGKGLRDWRLPRSYEPYYLNRLLRGSSHGLALFLVQTTVHAHRGQATARRLREDLLVLDLSFRP